MGKEAIVPYQWADESGDAKVILESHELILRKADRGSRKIIHFTEVSQVSVDGDQLHLQVGIDEIRLTLGAVQAQRWAKKITSPPPTLAAKLGITRLTRIYLIGQFENEELQTALSEAGSVTQTDSMNSGLTVRPVDLVVANVRTLSDLNHALDIYRTRINAPPIWFIYPKGVKSSKTPSLTIGETLIRNTLRQEGLIDTKVASVSPALTALRFIRKWK